jgi:hypothetical protein
MNSRASPLRQSGTAITEVIVALLALSPFLIGIPLLGKQLDVKHKSMDATRYAVWERTVWRSGGRGNRKDAADISLEARDRVLGDPRAAVVATQTLRTEGITENRLWRDMANERLLDYEDGAQPVGIEQSSAREPVEVGYFFVPAFTYGGGVISTAASVLRVHELGMDSRTFASADSRVTLRPLLQARARTAVSLQREDPNEADEPGLVQHAAGAILSDSWSSQDEREFGRRVDELTIDEFVETIELPSRILALNALAKGEPLFGEGQYAWDPDLRPSSVTLPRAYVEQRR